MYLSGFFMDHINDTQIVFSIWQGPGQVINGKNKWIMTIISPSCRNVLLKRNRAAIPESSRRPPCNANHSRVARRRATLSHTTKAHNMQMN